MTKKDTIIQAVKFTLFSISAAIVQILSFTLFNELFHWPYWLAYGISLALSVIWNCTFNRKFTFKSATNITRAMLLALLFYVPFTPLTTLGGDALKNSGWNEYLVLILTMLLNFVLEFLWQKFVIFGDKQKATPAEDTSNADNDPSDKDNTDTNSTDNSSVTDDNPVDDNTDTASNSR